MEKSVVFEIKEHLGVLEEYESGWKKELNIVQWNGGSPKYDIRDWNPEHEYMSKGVALTTKQAVKVVELLKGKLENL